MQDNNFAYNVGDEYPRKGVKVLASRYKELASSKNRQGVPLIEEIPEDFFVYDPHKYTHYPKIAATTEKAPPQGCLFHWSGLLLGAAGTVHQQRIHLGDGYILVQNPVNGVADRHFDALVICKGMIVVECPKGIKSLDI